jgi:hypothetical protein
MKTVLNFSRLIQQKLFAAHPSAGSPPTDSDSPPDAARPPITGVQRIVFCACLTAVNCVLFCICFTSPVAAQKCEEANRLDGGIFTGEPTPGARGTEESNTVAAIDFSLSAGSAHYHIAVTNDVNGQALSGFSPVSEPGIWSMIGLGFLILLARPRIFGNVKP